MELAENIRALVAIVEVVVSKTVSTYDMSQVVDSSIIQ